MRNRIVLTLLLALTVAALGYQLLAPPRPAPTARLTAYLPQDALLTLQSPDFASLLKRWTNSPECRAWLASDNDAVFQNSRLFGRLGDAQTSFEAAAGVPADADFLAHIAGKESVFAWYDIGKLEFLYITRMPAAQAAQTQLFQSRGHFERRHAGASDFYLRTSRSDYGTVAFASVPTPSGDLLLLATREDLIANALKLIAQPETGSSIEQEPWFHDASAALPAEKAGPALHMVLNLDRIAPDPHFRSYWIQRNVPRMKQFRASAADLYLEPTRFREERVLLPKSPSPEMPPSADISSLAALVPPSTGVFRAVATQDSAAAVTAIQEKLLGADTPPPPNPESAPDPSLAGPRTGSASDLETRIDTLPPASPSASTAQLRALLESSGTEAVLTLSSAEPAASPDGLWIPIHSAVIVRTGKPADPQALRAALQQTLCGALTTANIGITFQPTPVGDRTVYALGGPRPLFFALAATPAAGNLLLLADDGALLQQVLHNLGAASTADASATMIAVFSHASQRAPYARLTSLVDATNGGNSGSARDPAQGADVGAAPTFFSSNIRSLSDAFASLVSEQVVERSVDSNLRQTVTYVWKTP